MPRAVSDPTRLRAFFVAIVLLSSATSCLEWDRSTSTEVRDLTLFVSSVTTVDGRRASFNPGAAPASATGNTVTAALPPIVLKGGASQVAFRSSVPFDRVVIAAEGYTGYYELVLARSDTVASVLIAYAQQVGAPAFDLRYAAGTAGSLGAYQNENVAFLPNGTGEVQVNITWNTRADIDLYVVDPLGKEIYYADRQSNSGGQLDIDSNAACSSDGPRAENIFWPFGVVPPRGEYEVRVNNWSACGVESTDYVITIRTKDGIPQVFTGTLRGPGNGGAVGAGVRVTSFTY
jgi:hypothetical protein